MTRAQREKKNEMFLDDSVVGYTIIDTTIELTRFDGLHPVYYISNLSVIRRTGPKLRSDPLDWRKYIKIVIAPIVVRRRIFP